MHNLVHVLTMATFTKQRPFITDLRTKPNKVYTIWHTEQISVVSVWTSAKTKTRYCNTVHTFKQFIKNWSVYRRGQLSKSFVLL